MQPDVALEQVGADATVLDVKKQIGAEAIDAADEETLQI